MSEGKITDVVALAKMMDFAAPHYITTQRGGIRENKQGFINDLGIVLGGIQTRVGYPPYTLIDDEHNMAQYYVGYNAFVPNGSSGFRDDLTDGVQNQVRHFMGGDGGRIMVD